MRYRVEGETLNAIVVRVFQDSFEFLRPDDDCFVSTSTGKSFSITAVRQAIDDVFVACKLVSG